MRAWRSGAGFSLSVVARSAGYMELIVEGEARAVAAKFDGESGGHRHQRVPPTEKRGRVHTSTVTVAVLPVPGATGRLRIEDVDIQRTKGSGAGGQHRNVTESAIVAVHRPTGVSVRICNERSQHRNLELALGVLAARVTRQANERSHEVLNGRRRELVGSGMRADKIRTYRADGVVDHRTGARARLADVLDGRWPW